MKKVDIQVFDNGDFLREARSRLYRRCPDGTTGVVFRKKVYPLTDINKIDISGNFFGKDECPLIETKTPKIKKNENEELPFNWYLETNKFGHYIVLDGDSQLFESVLNFLDGKNIDWIRADESTREADDGKQYDWFIRLDTKDDRQSVINHLQSIFNQFISSSPDESGYDNLVKKYQQDMKDYKLIIMEFKKEIGDLNRKLEIADSTVQNYKDELSNLHGTKEERSNSNTELKNQVEEYIEMAQELSDENMIIEKENSLLKEKNKKLELQLNSSNSIVHSATNTRYKKINLIAQLFQASYPNIRFTDKCIATLVDYYTSFNSICRQLNILLYDYDNYQIKKVKGTKHWWESNSHISTGVDNAGRIYFKQLINNKNYKYEVNIRTKKTQKKDIGILIEHKNN